MFKFKHSMIAVALIGGFVLIAIASINADVDARQQIDLQGNATHVI